MANKWYIEILAGNRGAVESTIYPTGWSKTEVINEKQQLSATMPYDANVAEGKYFYLKNDRDDASWFYGIIKEVSASLFPTQAISITAHCNLEELSQFDVGELEIHQPGDGDPIIVRRIAKAGPRATFGFVNVDYDIEIPELSDNSIGTTYNWDVWGGDGDTKFGFGMDALYIASRVPIYNAQFNILSPSSDAGFDTNTNIEFEYLSFSDNGKGWASVGITDNTSEFQNSGIRTIEINTDLSGQVVKSSQSDVYAFWYRVWFRMSGGFNPQTTIQLRDIRINKRSPVNDSIGRIINPIAGWGPPHTYPTTTTDLVYHQFTGGSALKALRLISKMTGGFFTNGSDATENHVNWRNSSTENLVDKALAPITFSDANQNIINLKRKEVAATATRFTPYAAGHGQNRITCELQNVYGASFVLNGDTYSFSASTNLLVNTTAEAALGKAIHKELNIAYISSLYASGQSIDASNQLMQMAVRLLEKASNTSRQAYTITVGNLLNEVVVGDTARLTFSSPSVTIDEAFIITSARSQYSGTSTSIFELSSDGFFLDDIDEKMSDVLLEVGDKTTARQPISSIDVEGGGVGGGGGGVGVGDDLGSHIAQINLDMGGFSITNVNLVDGVDVSAIGTTNLGWNTSNNQVTNTQGSNATIPDATVSIDGLMTKEDKAKLSGIDSGAEANDPTNLSYTQSTRLLSSSTGNNVNLPLATTSLDGLMSDSDKSKLTGIAPNANNYSHPNHSGDVVSSGDGATTIQPGVVGNNELADFSVSTTKVQGNSINESKILDDAVTFAKLQNISTDRFIGRDAAGTGNAEELTMATARSMLNVENGANNYSHPNHSGDITSSGDGATTLQAAVISGKAIITAVTGDYLLIWDATDSALKRVNASQFLASAGTNLGYTQSTRLLTSSTGSNVTLPLATTSLAGLMSDAQFDKLDGIATGAQVNVGTNLGYTASSRVLTSDTGSDVTLPLATSSTPGLMNGPDVVKLGSIATGAQVNEAHTADALNNPGVALTSSGGETIFSKLRVGISSAISGEYTIGLGGKASLWSATSEFYKLFNAYFDGSWKRRSTGSVFAQIITNDDYYFLSSDSGAANSTISWRQLLWLRRDGGIQMPSIKTATPTPSGNNGEIWRDGGVMRWGNETLPTTNPGTDRFWVSSNQVVYGNYTGAGGTAPTWTLASIVIGNSWGQDGTEPIEYRLSEDGNSIIFQGKIIRTAATSPAQDTLLFTLNAGFRPSQTQFVSTRLLRDTSDPRRDGSVRVQSNGEVRIWAVETSIKEIGIYGVVPLR